MDGSQHVENKQYVESFFFPPSFSRSAINQSYHVVFEILRGFPLLECFLDCVRTNHPRDFRMVGKDAPKGKDRYTKLTIEMRARPEKTQELYQTLQALLPAIRKEKGCRDCRVWRDVEDGEVFFLAIDWEARASREQAVRSASGGALLGAVELLSETARVRLSPDSPWEGIDTLKRMRKTT
jgi:quinol monooxygenase YgiN